MPPTFKLVVIRGPEAGKELALSEEIKLVGRSSDAHLRLNDRSVSRHHFHVHGTTRGAHIQVCGNAAPILHLGIDTAEADVKMGESFVAGDTEILVAPSKASAAHRNHQHEGDATTISSLLTGEAMEVRGLAALFSLNDALSAARDPAAVQSALGAWARLHAACDAVDMHAGTADSHISTATAPAERIPIIETAAASGTQILVPARGASTGWFGFTIHLKPNQITDSLRRLLVLAAALGASRMTQLSLLVAAKDEGESFRKQAVGSARAFLGSSEAAAELIRLIPRLASSDASVLLLGETGAGKSFVARQIHESGPRKDEPFRIINCASLPETLIESLLFGHERGAFTGAVAAQAGALEMVGGGTILLDEIGELSLGSQAKLLHVLEERRFERLGSNRTMPLRARILAATNRDLESMVSAGTFRSDLYFRIAIVIATVPPLRERGDALLALANEILSDFRASADRRIEGFSPDAMDAIRGYSWPGNVRELRNAIERAIVTGEGPWIRARDLPAGVRAPLVHSTKEDPFLVRLPANLDWLERRCMEAALQETGGNQTKAAALLGIGRNTLAIKMRESSK